MAKKRDKNDAKLARRRAKKNPNARKVMSKSVGKFELKKSVKTTMQNRLDRMNGRINDAKEKSKEMRGKHVSKAKQMFDMAVDAQAKQQVFAEEENTRQVRHNDAAGEQTRKAFMKQLHQVVQKADVILEVLDARDPMGGRCPSVEKYVLGGGIGRKRLILVLNKIDLIEDENITNMWMMRLRKEFPTIAFKASTQQQRSHLSRVDMNATKADSKTLQTSKCVGGDALLQLLKNYSRNHKIKESITVGVIGYPNVGKSSIINSLKRSKAVGVSPQPGFTKNLQEVALDSKLKLLDCPGVIFEDSNGNDQLLRNVVSIEAMEDPVQAASALIPRCNEQKLMEIYEVPPFNGNVHMFMFHLAKNRGKLKAGGVVDQVAAAKIVLKDWNRGRIPYYTMPPPIEEDGKTVEIADGWAKEFNIDEVEKGHFIARHDEMEDDSTMDVPDAPVDMVPRMHDINDDSDGDDDGHESAMDTFVPRARKEEMFTPLEKKLNPQKGKMLKQKLKAAQKQRKKETEELMVVLEAEHAERENMMNAFDISL
eukprot:TRINITY_DN777889_c0_g1_i1.p1 TRINITY_DN777889_c0_g1~~TRINITY_DN777889_c0_g1_i1.p1  ORF type:complete len:538 (-),score=208.70 TRINITY_DN777889_c0_g1_i1:1509-3122(-)